MMVELGVAITWIAISAISVRGLSALARAAATSHADAEPASPAGDWAMSHAGLRYSIDVSSRLLRESP
jgi:hypothetical protein